MDIEELRKDRDLLLDKLGRICALTCEDGAYLEDRGMTLSAKRTRLISDITCSDDRIVAMGDTYLHDTRKGRGECNTPDLDLIAAAIERDAA